MEDDMRTPPSKAEVKREKADYQKRGATAKMPRLKERMTDATPRLKEKMTDTGRKGMTKPPKARSSKKR